MREIPSQKLLRLPRSKLVVLLTLLAAFVTGCAGVPYDERPDRRATDVWDTSLLSVRHIDLASRTFGEVAFDVTGFSSAVAGDGDRLYVIDSGSRRILEVNLATEAVRTLGTLRDANSPGLVVGFDGRVYALDAADRVVHVFDPFSGQRQRVSLGDMVAMPVDLALIDGRDLAVLDGLDGRAVLLDVQSGVYAERLLRRPEHPVVASARAIASVGETLLVLDGHADDVAGFDVSSQPIGLFASDELHDARAMAADACGRFFVSDGDDGTIYIGIPDMSVPGIRVSAEGLSGRDVADLWTDGVFLYAATRASGIFVYLVDPGCD